MRRTFRQVMKEAGTLLWKDIKDARWVIIVIIAYFAFLKTVLHNTCPMVMITGYPCPACGLTRAGMNLLHLNFAGAWRMHPFIYLVVLFAAVFCIRRYIWKKKGLGMLRWAAGLLIAGLVLYYIYRMAVYFPGNPPMSYYSDNLLEKLHLAIIKAPW